MRHFTRLGLLAVIAAGANTAHAQISLLPGKTPVSTVTVAETVSTTEKVATTAAVQTAEDDYINSLTQRQWVQLNAEGIAIGQFGHLNAATGATNEVGARITLARDGKVVREFTTNAEGKFAIAGVAPGTYSIVARSSTSVAAFALHLIPAGSSHVLNSDFAFYGASTASPVVEQLLRKHVVPAQLVSTGIPTYRDLMADPLGDRREVNDKPTVRVREGNVLVGRVSKPGMRLSEQDLTGNTAYIIQNGKTVGTGVVAKDGFFQISNVQPGAYELVVVGDDGIAVSGFQAIGATDRVSQVASKVVYVAKQVDGVSDTLQVEMAPAPDIMGGPGVIEEGGLAPIAGGGFAGPGGFAGGAGGGAGGGGGLGGLGGLLGIGGLAAGVAALASNNDNVSEATPTTPPPQNP